MNAISRHMILDNTDNSWFDTGNTNDNNERIYTDGVEKLTIAQIVNKYGIPGR